MFNFFISTPSKGHRYPVMNTTQPIGHTNITRNGLVILQWNAKGLHSSGHGHELVSFIKRYHPIPDVICIQETWINPSKSKKPTFKIPGYTGEFFNNTFTARGGLATYVKHNLSYKVLPHTDHSPCIQSLGLRILGRENDIDIINIYVSPGSAQASLAVRDYANLTKHLCNDTIIVGDFNSYNTLWGSRYTSNQGSVVEEFLDLNDLVCLNDDSPTFISDIHGTFSCIDLSLVSSKIASKCEWQVINDLNSDHYPIVIKYNIISDWSDSPKHIPKWKLDKANWKGFFDSCLNLDHASLFSDNIDLFNKNITEAINYVAKRCIPETKAFSSLKNVPWWNDDLAKSIKSRNKLRRKLQKNKGDVELFTVLNKPNMK